MVLFVYLVQIRKTEMSTLEKKSRQGRASKEQLEAMIDYFILHPHVASGKFVSLHGRDELRGSWEELAAQLNAISKDGKQKDVNSWKTTWRDNKTKVSGKVAKLRAGRVQTGNKPINIELSELEKKILGIIGYDYVEGVQESYDSFPEEQINAIELLSEGNKEILDAAPIAISCREDTIDSDAVRDIDIPASQPIQIEFVNETEAPRNLYVETMEPTNKRSENIMTSTSEDNSRNITELGRKGIKRKINNERLGNQLSEARKVFQQMEQQNIDTMKLQVDSTAKLADAVHLMAQNDSRRNDIMERMVENDRERNLLLASLTRLLEKTLPKQ